MIPARLHRVWVGPAAMPEQYERWWERWQALHPTWEARTWGDADADAFPLTRDAWPRCSAPAQQADLMRLELLYHHGGVYVDADTEPYRAIGALQCLPGFAAWDRPGWVGNAVMGAVPMHPGIRSCIRAALPQVGQAPYETGPAITTAVLPGRRDFLLLPPQTFYPVRWDEPEDADTDWSRIEWVIARHHFAGSWT